VENTRATAIGVIRTPDGDKDCGGWDDQFSGLGDAGGGPLQEGIIGFSDLDLDHENAYLSCQRHLA
jgi:hypothetical protein